MRLKQSPFDINSIVFHFDDFNYGRRSQPYFYCNNCNSAGFFHNLKCIIKLKNIYHTVGTVPTFNRKIVEICKFDTPNTHTNDPSWLSSGTSIKNDGVKLVYSRFF